MGSYAGHVVAYLDDHEPTQAQIIEMYDQIPPSQFEIYFSELRTRCNFYHEPEIERRPVNGLNVEIGAPMPRCLAKSPDGRGIIWLWSGGSPLSYGLCSCSECPRIHQAKERTP